MIKLHAALQLLCGHFTALLCLIPTGNSSLPAPNPSDKRQPCSHARAVRTGTRTSTHPNDTSSFASPSSEPPGCREWLRIPTDPERQNISTVTICCFRVGITPQKNNFGKFFFVFVLFCSISGFVGGVFCRMPLPRLGFQGSPGSPGSHSTRWHR